MCEELRKAVSRMEGQVAGLVVGLKNLEEHVMPDIRKRLNQAERVEGGRCSCKEYIEEDEEVKDEKVKDEEIKEEIKEVTRGEADQQPGAREEPKEMGVEKAGHVKKEDSEQAGEKPKELGVEKAGQVKEDEDGEDKETLEEGVGEEPGESPSKELTVREVWRALQKEEAGAGSQDNRFKKQRRVEQLM